MNTPNNFEPTPPHVLKAIYEIAAYLRECNLEQAIISHSGGASFLLTNIYKEIANLSESPSSAPKDPQTN